VTTLNNLLNFVNVSSYYQWVIQGLIIIIAVGFNTSGRRR
jgi:ribose transport system permease protein